MNLHPIIVHFPVACLTIYSILELISSFSVKLHTKLKFTKRLLLFIGVAAVFFALQTGETAQKLYGVSTLIRTHEDFAQRTYITYIVLSIIYLTERLSSNSLGRVIMSHRNQTKLSHFMDKRFIQIVCAVISIIGLGLLTITGALGGAISHGKNSDPVAKRVTSVFVK